MEIGAIRTGVSASVGVKRQRRWPLAISTNEFQMSIAAMELQSVTLANFSRPNSELEKKTFSLRLLRFTPSFRKLRVRARGVMATRHSVQVVRCGFESRRVHSPDLWRRVSQGENAEIISLCNLTSHSGRLILTLGQSALHHDLKNGSGFSGAISISA